MKSTSSNSNAASEVNMTPLIDVSLVLVVILMLATPLAFESSIAVRRSQPETREAPRDRKLESIEIHVVTDDRVRIAGQTVSRHELRRVLEPMIESNAGTTVVVACSDPVSHGSFVDVLDVAKLSGARSIAVLGR